MTKFKDLYTQLDTQLYNEIQNQYESRSATGLLQDVEQTTQWKKNMEITSNIYSWRSVFDQLWKQVQNANLMS